MSEGKIPTAERIEKRAYELYLERGGENGRDFDDWVIAEKELTQVSEQSASAATRARASRVGRLD